MAYLGNSPGVASQRIVTTFTATAGQTTFTPSSGYALGYCDVFQNGVKLVAGDDYTASNGTTVVLATGASAGDSVEVVAYIPRGLSDGYTKAEADALLAGKVSKSGDVITGNLSMTRALTGAQIGGVQWNGDINDAKWSTKLGGYFLSFLNPSAGNPANLEASPISLDGLSWRSKARLHPDGYIEVAQGVKFPAAQNGSADANTLDDYEEGTWTPYVTFDGPNDSSYLSRYGRYTKIGNLVTVMFKIMLSARGSGGTGLARIYGLPFTVASAGAIDNPIGSGSLLVGNLTGVSGTLNVWLDNNGTGVIPYTNESGAGAFTFHGNWTNSSWVTGTATYQTN